MIDADGGIDLVYWWKQDWKTRSHDRRTRKQDIKIVVKGNIMKLRENGKYIAKVYRNTLKDRSDWEWLIDYFGK